MGYGQCALERATDFMIDIETTGLRPDRHAMIQLAALPFRIDTFEVGATYFDQCLQIPPARGWSESTRDWWYSKNSHVLQTLFPRMMDPAFVMQNFQNFVHQAPKGARFWCKRFFDWQFVESYFHDYNIANPFHYHDVHEMITFLKGMAYPNSLPNVPVEIQPVEGFDAHNAYYDVLKQTYKLLGVINALRGSPCLVDTPVIETPYSITPAVST